MITSFHFQFITARLTLDWMIIEDHAQACEVLDAYIIIMLVHFNTCVQSQNNVAVLHKNLRSTGQCSASIALIIQFHIRCINYIHDDTEGTHDSSEAAKVKYVSVM